MDKSNRKSRNFVLDGISTELTIHDCSNSDRKKRHVSLFPTLSVFTAQPIRKRWNNVTRKYIFKK